MPCRPEMAVDITKVFEAKGKKLPKCLAAPINRFLHLDFLNKFIVRGYEGVEFCTKALEYLDVNIETEGLENVPDDGTLYTFVSNHPLGGIDGVALGSIIGNRFGNKLKYFLNDILMHIHGLAVMGIPVNKTGGQMKDLPRLIDEAFHSDNHIILFPAGACSRMINGRIQDVEWSKAFISKSIETRRSVVPIHFIARNSKRFYRIASWQKKLKLKFNVAMAFLPDEMYRNRHSTFKVIFGKPIPYTVFDNTKRPSEWAQWVREQVYKL